ncbi:hypothetical protein Sfum_3589 [Syntrophobacter fumaroxidans MPOB]|uniref:Uncharacterized protein n=1 Tax=Syntrophobacter fumaroxidans (strain DSM 10017 / MPOB) TaxID=335543 RepID=A0LPA7_SYNFM|nr:hypothetical protein Sfum_3589 [Syntrophobacter fumaroxidans MPOB]
MNAVEVSNVTVPVLHRGAFGSGENKDRQPESTCFFISLPRMVDHSRGASLRDGPFEVRRFLRANPGRADLRCAPVSGVPGGNASRTSRHGTRCRFCAAVARTRRREFCAPVKNCLDSKQHCQ